MHGRDLAWTLAIAVAALVWLGALFQATPLTPINGGEDRYDGQFYAAMARDPWTASPMTRLAPFCWRVLSPLAVHQMGMGAVEGFLLLSVAGQWIAALLLWALLRRLGVDAPLAAMGVALLLTSFWGPRYAFWSPCHPETVTLVLALALALATVSGGRWTLGVLFAVAALQREQLMTFALFVWLWLWTHERRRPLRALGLAALVALPGVAVLAGLRLTVTPVNPRGLVETMGFYGSLRWGHVIESQGLYVARFLAGSLRALGAVPWLIVLGGPPLWRRLRGESAWLALALVTWLLVWFAGTDTERRAFHAFPLLLVPLLVHWRETPLARATWPVAALAFAVHVVLNLVMVKVGDPDRHHASITETMPDALFLRALGLSAALWLTLLLGGATLIRWSRPPTPGSSGAFPAGGQHRPGDRR